MKRSGLALLLALGSCDSSTESPPTLPSPAAPAAQASQPEPTKPAAPAPVATAPTRSSVALSSEHTCAIVRRAGESTDRVKCWGQNAHGQLGLSDRAPRTADQGDMGDALPFVELPGVTALTSIDASSGRTCALEASGALWCWGEGAMADPSDAPPPGPAKVPLPGPATAFALGRDAACAVLSDGTLRCWGGNRSGILGTGDPVEPSKRLPAVDLGALAHVVDVAAGQEHACALLSTGRVKCFGDGTLGQLGLPDTAPRGGEPGQMGDALPFTDLGEGFRATAISVDAFHGCALSSAGAVSCWGANRQGQLGQGHSRSPGGKPGEPRTPASPAPVDIGPSAAVTQVYAGNTASCAIVSRDGAGPGLACWGALPRGGARGDEPEEMGEAMPLVALGADRLPVEIGLSSYACAVVMSPAEIEAGDETGRLLCWGFSPDGALGIDIDPYAFERPDAMGDALPFVDLGDGVRVITRS